MSVRELASAVDLAARVAAEDAVRRVMDLPPVEVEDLAAARVTGDPLVSLAAAVLGDRFVDRYAAGLVLGVPVGR